MSMPKQEYAAVRLPSMAGWDVRRCGDGQVVAFCWDDWQMANLIAQALNERKDVLAALAMVKRWLDMKPEDGKPLPTYDEVSKAVDETLELIERKP